MRPVVNSSNQQWVSKRERKRAKIGHHQSTSTGVAVGTVAFPPEIGSAREWQINLLKTSVSSKPDESGTRNGEGKCHYISILMLGILFIRKEMNEPSEKKIGRR